MEHLLFVCLQNHPSVGGFHFLYLSGQSWDLAVILICHDPSLPSLVTMLDHSVAVEMIGMLSLNSIERLPFLSASLSLL